MRWPPLYAIVDPLNTGREPIALGETLLAGGARCLQLRLKDWPSAELLRVARALRSATRAAGALLIINDRADIAAAASADGVHLGQDDLPIQAARRILPPGALIGISTHDVNQAVAAAAAGADYLGVGPIYTTTSKPGALSPRGPALLRAVRTTVDLPLVAIGGITPETAPDLITAGATSVAMIKALVSAPDVTIATRATVARLSA